jgi:hypothetical protein
MASRRSSDCLPGGRRGRRRRRNGDDNGDDFFSTSPSSSAAAAPLSAFSSDHSAYRTTEGTPEASASVSPWTERGRGGGGAWGCCCCQATAEDARGSFSSSAFLPSSSAFFVGMKQKTRSPLRTSREEDLCGFVF